MRHFNLKWENLEKSVQVRRPALKESKSFKFGAAQEASLRPKPTEVTNKGPAGNGEKLRRREQPNSQTGPGPKHKSQETIGFAWGSEGLPQAQDSVDRHPPRQGEPVRAGSARVLLPAHALFPLRHSSPSPQSRLPSEPGSSREVSAVWPARPRGMRTQPGPQQGLSQDPPGLGG